MNAIAGIRQMVGQIFESGHAVIRLVDRGIIEPLDIGAVVRSAKLARQFGPQATMAIQGGRRYADLPAIVDERGALTYKQVDDQSWRWRTACSAWGSRKAPLSGCCAGIIAV